MDRCGFGTLLLKAQGGGGTPPDSCHRLQRSAYRETTERDRPLGKVAEDVMGYLKSRRSK